MKTQNIYMIIIILAILFLLLDLVLSKVHFKVENFANQPSSSPSELSRIVIEISFSTMFISSGVPFMIALY